jgi:hypothetical protein
MRRGIVLVWVATLLTVMVAAWREAWCGTDATLRAMSLGALIDGRRVEYPPTLVTPIEALDIDRLRRGVLVAVGARRVEPIQGPRVRPARRTARGPPAGP